MKQLLCILITVSLASGLKAGNTTAELNDHVFTIHIGAFVKANITDFKSIRQFGYLYTKKFNSLQQVYMGEYDSEAAANKVLLQVKNAGFMDAFTTRRSIKDGKTVTIIQLGAKAVGEDIDWSEFASAGPLNVLLSGNSVKIVTGAFEDLDGAKQRLLQVREMGFSDAFMKNVNELLLHRVTSFETGGKVNIPREFSYVSEPVKIVMEDKVSQPAAATQAKSAPPQAEAIPESYEETFVAKSPLVSNEIAEPSIRKNVKRTSVLRLQEVLKAEGTYTGSLDGFYGPGTAKGYSQTMSENPEIQKYQALVSLARSKKESGSSTVITAGDMLNWEPVVLLKTIVSDLNPSPGKTDPKTAAEKKLKQEELLAAKKAPNAAEYAYIDSWNESLWNGINAWEKSDPLHKRMTTPLKIAYFQSWALFEDFFMNKGFEARDARAMSLYVLQNIVEPALSGYKK